jgi:uncharacterized repeat protein (TIGR01451 family)
MRETSGRSKDCLWSSKTEFCCTENATMKSKRLFQSLILLALIFTSLGSNQPVSASTDSVDQLDAVVIDRNLDYWDNNYLGYASSSIYENWRLGLAESHNFIVTVTPFIGDLNPLLILLDADGNELMRGIGTITSAQPAGDYSILVQPQTGAGFYFLLLQDVDQTQPLTTVLIAPSSLNLSETAVATVSLNNVPAEGFTSAEFTCLYDSSVVGVSNIVVPNRFGPDPAVAINGPQNNSFIVAIAGSRGDKATTSGTAFTFDLKGLQAGQSAIECTSRVSKGDKVLVELPSIGSRLTVLGNAPTSTTTVPMRITLDPGQTTASRIGIINPNETIRYLLNAAQGQVLSLNLTAPANEIAIGVNGPTGLVLKPLDASLTWSTTVTTDGDHTITLMALTGASSKSYTLQVSLTPPAATATPTATPTLGPTLCDKVQLIADITVPDGTVFSPGATFTKAWRLKNVGSCTWTTSYQLVFFSGELMGAVSPASFSQNVAPGQTVDISINMTAPSAPGSYRGYWMFENANGALFGMGAQADKPWWVDIRVAGATATPTFVPTPCDKAEFIADVNVPPGTVMSPGAQFTKTWRLKNVSTCTWTLSYRLAFFGGDQMGAPSSIQVPVNVAPGQMIDLSLNLTAPSSPGSYRGYWIFQNSTGFPFGVGPQGDQPVYVDIVVASGTVTPTGTQPSSILSLTKSASSQTYSAPDQTITYTFTITNTGTTALGPAQFIITDNKLGAPFNCGPADATLAPSQSLSCSMDYKTTSADMALPNIINSATAAGAGQISRVATIVVTNLVAPATPTPSVTPGGPSATPVPGTVYDFATNACEATWYTGAGQLTQCPGTDGDAKGFVLKVSNPKLESGVTDPRPGILTFPQDVQNGYIQGFYPPFHVQNGDRFRSTIGCEFGATSCYLAFRLDYELGDTIRTFWGPFLERYDGKHYSIDVDLSPLAGEDVRFILTVLSAGVATGDRALWVGPIIYRADSISTPTSEVSLTPTLDASPTGTLTSTLESTPTDFTGTPMPAVGLITGKVFASKLVRIEAYNANHNLVGAGWVDPDGSFAFSAPSETDIVIAMANGFLSAQRSVTITDGSTTTLPTITLLAGDIDGNNVIDPFDVLTIGMNYNMTSPSVADLNNDGIINVLDLELLARNYRKTGPVDWQ